MTLEYFQLWSWDETKPTRFDFTRISSTHIIYVYEMHYMITFILPKNHIYFLLSELLHVRLSDIKQRHYLNANNQLFDPETSQH